MTTLPIRDYQEFVKAVLELLPNDPYHNTSLTGAFFFDSSDVANGIPDPVAKVCINRDGYYATHDGFTLIEGVTEEEAFETLIGHLEELNGNWPHDIYEEFTRGGNP
jgi:hypothetical protein